MSLLLPLRCSILSLSLTSHLNSPHVEDEDEDDDDDDDDDDVDFLHRRFIDVASDDSRQGCRHLAPAPPLTSVSTSAVTEQPTAERTFLLAATARG
eukprot:745936-Hanusia_phi.AAC.2